MAQKIIIKNENTHPVSWINIKTFFCVSQTFLMLKKCIFHSPKTQYLLSRLIIDWRNVSGKRSDRPHQERLSHSHLVSSWTDTFSKKSIWSSSFATRGSYVQIPPRFDKHGARRWTTATSRSVNTWCKHALCSLMAHGSRCGCSGTRCTWGWCQRGNLRVNTPSLLTCGRRLSVLLITNRRGKVG